MENEKLICDCCGEEIDLTNIKENAKDIMVKELLCADCFSDLYRICDLCSEYELLEDMETINDDLLFCRHCFETDGDVFYCEYHERYEHDIYKIRVQNYGTICDDAYTYSGVFDYCEECGDFFMSEDMDYSGDEIVCEQCSQGNIKGYHAHSSSYGDNKLYANAHNQNENPLMFGFELEVERKRSPLSIGTMAKQLAEDTKFVVLERDSSLDDGFEIISYPFSMEYMNCSGEEEVYRMLKKLDKEKYASHDTNTCGLHFHVGRHELGDNGIERHKTVMNVMCIVEYFKEELTIFSRRKENNLNKWSKFMTTYMTKSELTREIIMDIILDDNDRSKYRAVNLNNDNTIEFRIFRGTTRFETFMASFELVHNIVAYALENKITDLNKLDFVEIATYKCDEYISDYLTEKGLMTEATI